MDIKFEGENSHTTRTRNSQQTESGIIGLLIKNGLAKNKQQANNVLLTLLVICLILITVLLFSRGDGSESPEVILSDQEVLEAGAPSEIENN